MKEIKVQFNELTLPYVMDGDRWNTELAKSQTRITDVRQLSLMTDVSELFVPVKIEEEEDLYRFSYLIKEDNYQWNEIKDLPRNEKLRLLCNIARLENIISTRITFFLHPDNVVFDCNLLPRIVYRGIRGILPPFEMEVQDFLKQYKCFAIALFSKVYSFDDLYNGQLKNCKENDFEKRVSEIDYLAELIAYLEDCFIKEQDKTDRTMKVVSIKQFRLFKRLAIIMSAVSLILVIPLVYYIFSKDPYQERLLTAHGEFLADNYSSVISTLRSDEPEQLPYRTKYILANSYIQVESLSNREKDVIMRNISLRSDENYLLYWIYNGRGKFEESIELAKYIDDPQLIMYGLIKQIEGARNNPHLSGSERDEMVKQLQDELNQYRANYIEFDEEESFDEFSEGQSDGDVDVEPESEPEAEAGSEADAELERETESNSIGEQEIDLEGNEEEEENES
ncbi:MULTISPECIES: type VII secretion protein EssB [Bacillaceae]|uniref:Type VII secretion protein EssB n=1 Tax=Evansella alkalicola TaxID=745819 RepID=A0ABS6JYB8_9BACI|nr:MULTISPECIES: type VII secretion protein EssB [Bacillaceae]MBU9723483.1 type VII secretion protein EssB [Bacillus alkalicola]